LIQFQENLGGIKRIREAQRQTISPSMTRPPAFLVGGSGVLVALALSSKTGENTGI
jgi:hypothetical protein